MTGEERRLSKQSDIERFLFGGSAYFSLVSLKTGKRLGFKCSEWHGRYYVNTYGLHNCRATLGYFEDKYVKLWHPAAYHGPLAEEHFLGFQWWLRHTDSSMVQFWHMGKCCMCGKTLTDPESIERGIGPTCYGKATSKKKRFAKEELPF